jgi:hypothetical protein
MTHVEQWRALSARIRALTGAAHLYAQFQQSSTADTYGAGKHLGEQSQEILALLTEFAKSNRSTLPPGALAAVERFLTGHPGKVIGNHESAREVRAGTVFLAALESEISFLLTDRQEFVRARSERAFLHLQRSLAVDSDLRAKWLAAHNSGEVRCEALGSLHLLAHGIYAFKIDARGARTDLVFNEPADPLVDQRALEGLVLTEWKLADENNALSRFKEARIQTDLYKQGPLAVSELRDYRYLIAVSLKNLSKSAVPVDMIEGGVTYRHINIAVEPDLPSKLARK